MRVSKPGICLSLVIGLALTGCQASRDPSQAGVFGGLYHGVMTDSYAEDTAALERKAVAAEQRRDRLQAEAGRRERELASLQGERRALQERVARLNRELADKSAALDRARVDQASQRAELAELRRREAALTDRQLTASDADTADLEAQIRRLERDNARLAGDIDAFLSALG